MRTRALALAALFLPSLALAANVQGVLPADTTWTAAGSPYTVVGDLTVPTGVTLTIDPGVSVVFASSDGMGSGVDTAEVELIVDGTLKASGTAASGVSISATDGYGIRVQGTATFDYATLTAGPYGVVSSGNTTFNNSTVQNASTQCLRVSGGTTTFNNGTLKGCFQALYASGGTTNVGYSLLTGNGSSASYEEAVLLAAPATLSHNTLTGNQYMAVRVNSFSGTATIRDNIITSNGSYGLYFSSTSSPSRTVTHNDVWGHGTNYYNVSGGTGSISANPLFVGSGNYALTENSPARLAASDGTDIGAFAYAGAPTTSLMGKLFSNKTLTGANTLAGDLTVAPGVTLTLAAGATLTFASSDALGSGVDAGEVELIVDGTLAASGTSSSGVTLSATNGYGVRVQGTATFDYATISGGPYGVVSTGSSTFNNSTVQGASTQCLRVGAGTTTFTNGTLKSCFQAVYSYGGTTNISYSLLTANGSSSSYEEAVLLAAPATLSHNTITGNQYMAVRVNSFSGTATIQDNIITSNGSYGLYFSSTSSPSRVISHNDVWGHGTNYYNSSGGSGSISANPLFVGSGNYALTEYSPARNAASDGTDMGAFAYAGAPTSSLMGRLYTDKTLSGANTLAGDLTVAPGVTLTLAPGATLTFASSDGLGSGVDTSEVELIVDGTLTVSGSATSGVSISASNGYGVRVQGTATFDYATISGGPYGVTTSGSSTFNNSTVQGASTQCLRVSGGTTNFTNGTLKNCFQAIYSSGGTTNVSYSLLTGNGSSSSYEEAVLLAAPSTLVHNTISGNQYMAVRVNSFSGTATLRDNVITSNGSYGLYFASTSSPSRVITHNDVWGHGTNYYNSTGGTGSLSTNPLFLGSGNDALTENSPARMAASDGMDMGAFPYAGAPTPSLMGKLFTNRTLSGANTMTGDLIVAPGVTLTLAPGASLTFASSDAMGAGVDTSEAELIVDGTLTVGGTASSGVSISTANGYGIRVQGGATFDYATISAGPYGVLSSGSTTFNNSTIQGASTQCLRVSGGTTNFSNGTLQNCFQALYSSGGTTDVSYSLIRTSGSSTSYEEAILIAAPTSLIHNTITENKYMAVRVNSFSGTATVRDNIITSNGSYGLYFASTSSPSRAISYNDVWGHGTDYYNSSGGTGSISANPLFVSPGFNYTLEATSPCRNKASDGKDMGAFPYVPVAAAYVVVTPTSPSVTVKGTQQFTATAYDSANNPLPSATFTWSASSAAGTITQAGLFTAGCAPGSYPAAISATSGGKTGTADVTLTTGAVATVAVSPASASIGLNGSQQFTATVTDNCNNVLSSPVSWAVTSGGGTISSQGLFTAGSTTGTFSNTVRATSGTVSGYATVTVTGGSLASIDITPTSASVPINGTQQFTATGKDSAGNTVPVTVTWSVVNGGGSISGGGLFTAGTTSGTFANTVKATSGSISATATVTVNPGAVQTVTLSPPSVTLPVRGTQTFTATARDAHGNTVPGTTTWTVSPSSAGTITTAGAFTAGATAGSYPGAITATIDGVSASADVTLNPAVLARVVVTPSPVTIIAGGVQQFSAQGEDADGNIIAITPVWSVINGAGTISASGLLTATQVPGTYTDSVRATANGVHGLATVTVTSGTVSRVAIAPQNPTVAINGTVAFSAKAFDGFDNEIMGLMPAWKVTSGGGTIDQAGLFTAGAESGTYPDTVKVTLGTVSATTSVTVSEDFDGDGIPDAWEVANGLDPNDAADASLDPDADQLVNLDEFATGTNPDDADSDDDGAIDGLEQKPTEDADGDGLVNALDPDSDNDGLWDGLEMAVSTAHAGTDERKGTFTADADPESSTGPLSADTDGDGKKDGDEDANHDGKVDEGETDPNVPDRFCSADPECGEGNVCSAAGVCKIDPNVTMTSTGCGCSGAGSSTAGVLPVAMLLFVAAVGVRGRRRQVARATARR